MTARAARRSTTDWAARLLILIVLAAAWQWATTLGGIRPEVLPRPGAVGGALGQWLARGVIWPNFAATLEELALALVVGTLLGVAVALLLAYVPPLAVALQPFLSAINGLPRAALAPLFILWFGFGLTTQIALGALLIFFNAFLTTYEGLLGVDDAILRHVRLLGGGELQMLRYVYLPAILTWLIAGLRASVGLGFLGVIVGEYLGATQGLGYLLANARAATALDRAVAALFLIATTAGLISLLVSAAAERMQSRTLA